VSLYFIHITIIIHSRSHPHCRSKQFCLVYNPPFLADGSGEHNCARAQAYSRNPSSVRSAGVNARSRIHSKLALQEAETVWASALIATNLRAGVPLPHCSTWWRWASAHRSAERREAPHTRLWHPCGAHLAWPPHHYEQRKLNFTPSQLTNPSVINKQHFHQQHLIHWFHRAQKIWFSTCVCYELYNQCTCVM
jgi:hypothetical protein